MADSRKRVTVTLGEELYNTLKTRADTIGSSVPSLLVFYAMEHLKQEEMITQVPNLTSALRLFQTSMADKK